MDENDSKSEPAIARRRRDGETRLESSEEDAVLAAALRSGDPDAFEQLVRLHGPRLLAVARRILRSEEDARDCVQDAFLAAHRGIGNFEGRARLGTWLRRIVVNAALMKLRAGRARPEETIDSFLPTYDRWGFREGPRRSNSFTPEELLQQADVGKLVRSAMERLSENYRTVLLLRDIEGFSTEETAELVGASPGAVKVRLHRARTALKELLQPLFEEDLS